MISLTPSPFHSTLTSSGVACVFAVLSFCSKLEVESRLLVRDLDDDLNDTEQPFSQT